MEKQAFKTDVPARIKSVNGLSWYNARIVGLSKTGAKLEGRFVQKQETMVEIYVLSSDPSRKAHHLLATVVEVDENTLTVRFL